MKMNQDLKGSVKLYKSFAQIPEAMNEELELSCFL